MEPIYLEPDEEITSVIDKLSAAGGGKIAIVVPKNSTLFQSLVNLKLLAKQAKELNKEVAIISSNKVGQRLASQVGIESFATLGTIKERPSSPPVGESVEPPVTEEEHLPDGTPIRRYVPPQSSAKTAEEVAEPALEPVTVPPVVEPVNTESVEAPVPETLPEKNEEVKKVSEPTPKPDEIPEDLPAIVSRTPQPKREFHFQLPWKSLVAAAILLLIAFTITYLLLPKATVTVTLPAKAVSAALPLEVRAVKDNAEATVVGNLLTAEKSVSKPIAATGKKNIGTKAGGTITLYNKESSSPRTIAAGTVLTANDKKFTLNQTTTIPGATVSGGALVPGQTSAAITASEAGEAYNLSNTQFSITGQPSLVYGSGSTSGGTTKQVTILSQEDVDKGYADLEKQVVEEARAELTSKADKQTLLDGSIQQTVKERSVDKKVGDQVDSATAKLSVQLSVLVFDQGVAEEKFKKTLESQLDEGQRLEVPEDAKPTLTFKGYSEDKSTMTIEIAGRGYGVPNVTRSDIAAAIRHQSTSRAAQTLKEKYQAEEVDSKITPSWWFDRLPFLGGAIVVEYGFKEKTETEAAPETP